MSAILVTLDAAELPWIILALERSYADLERAASAEGKDPAFEAPCVIHKHLIETFQSLKDEPKA